MSDVQIPKLFVGVLFYLVFLGQYISSYLELALYTNLTSKITEIHLLCPSAAGINTECHHSQQSPSF